MPRAGGGLRGKGWRDRCPRGTRYFSTEDLGPEIQDRYRCWDLTLGPQRAQRRPYLCTHGCRIGISYIHVALACFLDHQLCGPPGFGEVAGGGSDRVDMRATVGGGSTITSMVSCC